MNTGDWKLPYPTHRTGCVFCYWLQMMAVEKFARMRKSKLKPSAEPKLSGKPVLKPHVHHARKLLPFYSE